MARAGNNQSATTTVSTPYRASFDGGSDLAVRSIIVIVPSGSAQPVRVNIPALHGADYVEIPAGMMVEFTDQENRAADGARLDRMNVQTGTGTGTYHFAATMN
jgi:hypothetical protein